MKRQRFWKLHAVLGTALGLPLFVIFLAGSFAFFVQEAINWTAPHHSRALPENLPSLDALVQNLDSQAGLMESVALLLVSNEHPVTKAFWRSQADDAHAVIRTEWLQNPIDGTIESAPGHHEDFAHFLVDLHYLNVFPQGRLLAGLIAMLFFSIILSGIVYQWRDLLKDLNLREMVRQTLTGWRPRFWRDWHRSLSALTLPYQVIFSITGGVLALGLLATSPTIFFFFEGDQSKLAAAVVPATSLAPSQPTSSLELDKTLDHANEIWGDKVTPYVVEVIHHHDPDGHSIVIDGRESGVGFFRQHYLVYSGDGELLQQYAPGDVLGASLIEAITNLHFGIFGSFWIKLAFAILGFVVTISIAFGVYILIERQRNRTRLDWVLSVLTRWIIGGIPLGIALGILFSTWRPELSEPVFWGCVLAALPLSALPQRRSSLTGLLAGAALFSLLSVLVFAVVHRQSPWPTSHTADWMISFFNTCLILLGATYAFIAWRVWVHPLDRSA